MFDPLCIFGVNMQDPVAQLGNEYHRIHSGQH
jgi:hypothetical protein